MTTTSFSYPSCSVCWFPRFTSASSFIPHGQAAKSSVAFLVRLQTICNEVALTFSPLRTKGDLGWHAWCQPRLLCTHLSESTRIVSRVNCELSPTPLFPLSHEYSSHFSALVLVFSQSCRPSSSSTLGKRSSLDAINWTSSRVSFRNCARSPSCYTTTPSG